LLMLLSLVPMAGSILLPRPNGNACVPATQPQHFREMTGLSITVAFLI
jgi:hypothetical protein